MLDMLDFLLCLLYAELWDKASSMEFGPARLLSAIRDEQQNRGWLL